MKKIIGLILFSICFTTILAQDIGGEMEVPSVKIRTMNGRPIDLQSYAQNDKFTIVSFWATWCKPCKKELDNLSYLLPEWKKEFDVELVAVSLDDSRTSRKVESYVNGKGWTFDVLLDVNSKTKRALNFSAIPYSIIIDKSGKIVYKHSGYQSGDEYVMKDKLEELKKEAKKKDG